MNTKRAVYFYDSSIIKIPGAPDIISDIFWEKLYYNARLNMLRTCSVIYIKGFQGGRINDYY